MTPYNQGCIAGAAAVAIGIIVGVSVPSCSAANRQYAADLQGCILAAKDAGPTRDEKLAAYTKCADDLDKDGGK